MDAIRRRARNLLRNDRGSMVWALILAVMLLMLTTAMINSTLVGVQRSAAQTNGVLTGQRLEAASAAAIRQLSSGGTLPKTAASGTVDCQTVDGRPMCYKMWATPVPGQAVNPTKYNLLIHTWIDNARNGVEPATGVRSELESLEAITYQTSAGQTPVVGNGYVAYSATPLGLFGNAIHAFNTATINGPTTTVSSYNSLTGVSGTGDATVSSDGTIEYGTDIKVDKSKLYGGQSTAGNYTERCTGEPCTESDVSVMMDTHQTPTAASVQWMYSAPCTTTVTGDWVASANSGTLPQGVLCIKGNLVIDAPTLRSVASSTVYVYGNVVIQQSLNAPATGQAMPGRVAIYSTGTAVTFDSKVVTAPGIGVAALIYAPLATCANTPSGNNPTTYYGSLVCGTVSIAGPWTHWYDDAGAVSLADPVPGAATVWAAGPPQNVDPGEYLQPEGWDQAWCVVPAPTNAKVAYKLDEKAGAVAHDSSGNGLDAGWLTTSRPDGMCGESAPMTPNGAVVGSQTLAGSTINGASVEWWAEGANGTVFAGAGIQVYNTTDGHVRVAVNGTLFQFPFTTQNYGSWHHYVVTISPAGAATLYVDGTAKESGTTGAIPLAGGAVNIANGSAGQVDEVAYYERQLTAADVAARWTMWNQNVVFTPTFAGTPFTAPGTITNAGSGPGLLSASWTAASGTLPAGVATYVVQDGTSAAGPFADLTTVPLTQTSLSQAAPYAAYYYRACTRYNGDTKCGAAVQINTVPLPAAPTVTTSNIQTQTATFSWTTPTYSASFQSQYRLNGGAWSGSTTASDGLSVLTHALSSPSITHGPTGYGYLIEVRVRAVNAAGLGPWSAVVGAQLLPGPPAVSVSSVGTTSATFSYTGVYAASSYQGQYRIDGGSWSAIQNNLASPTTVSNYIQGERVDYQVRGVLPDGRVGPWSTIATANESMSTPAANGYGQVYDNYPYLYGEIWNSGAPMCPGGALLQMQYRDQVTTWGSTWNPLGSWLTSGAGWTNSQWAVSTIGSYAVGANQEYNIRCYNPDSGNTSAIWGLHGPNALWHAIPAPTGQWAGITSWRVAGWGASCPGDSYPVYNPRVQAAFGDTGWMGWTTNTSYSNTGQAWGSYTISVGIACQAGSRSGPQVGASASG